MATSRNLGQFARRMHIRADQVVANTEKAVRRAALAADTAVVLATPVDTGRARAAWLASINSIRERFDVALDKSGTSTIADAQGIIDSWKLDAGTIFISNSVPYIVPLEEGHSKQAPTGMMQHGIAAARAELRQAKLLDGS